MTKDGIWESLVPGVPQAPQRSHGRALSLVVHVGSPGHAASDGRTVARAWAGLLQEWPHPHGTFAAPGAGGEEGSALVGVSLLDSDTQHPGSGHRCSAQGVWRLESPLLWEVSVCALCLRRGSQ